jgi:hypothetical protein
MGLIFAEGQHSLPHPIHAEDIRGFPAASKVIIDSHAG